MHNYSVSEIIDSFGVTRYTWKMFFMIGLTMLFDGFDYMIVSYTMPQMSIEWGLTSLQTGSLSTWSIFGIIIGGAVAGIFSDKFGRKKVLCVAIAWYSLLTLPICFVDNFTAFAILRVLAGVGIGACLPIGSTMNSEIAPTKQRALFVTGGMAFMVGGWCLAGICGTLVVPAFGWRPCFLIGALPVLYAIFLAFKLPESTYWLGSKHQYDRVIKNIEVMERVAKGSVSQWDAARLTFPPPAPKVGVSALFSKGYVQITLALWIVYFLGNLVVYGTTIWMPYLLIEKGLSMGSSYALSTAQNFAAIVANCCSGFVSERIGRRKHIVLSYLVTAAVVAAIALINGSVALILSVCILTGFFCNFAITGIQPLITESYRVEFRNTGVAWTQSFGRIGAIVAPLIVGYFVGLGYGAASLLVFVIPALLGAVTAGLCFRSETRGRSLDELAISKT